MVGGQIKYLSALAMQRVAMSEKQQQEQQQYYDLQISKYASHSSAKGLAQIIESEIPIDQDLLLILEEEDDA